LLQFNFFVLVTVLHRKLVARHASPKPFLPCVQSRYVARQTNPSLRTRYRYKGSKVSYREN